MQLTSAARLRRLRAFVIVPMGVAALAGLATHAIVAQSVTSDAQRLARLEAGVLAEEGVRAIKRLQHSYAHFMEWGLWSDAADLFTNDVVAQYGTRTITGRASLQKYLMEQGGNTAAGLRDGQLSSHLQLQPIITLGADGTTARGAWHEVALLGQYGTSASWAGGVYENEYALETGVWKISRVHFYPQYNGAYDDYGHKAPAKWDIPYHFDAAHLGVTIPASALAAIVPPGRGNAGQRAASLAARVQRLQDETEVENLQHTYGYYLDRKLWDDVADLFAEDGTFEAASRGVYVGKAHIRKALEALYGAAPLKRGELFDHINLSTVVTIAGNGRSAGARTISLDQLGLNGEYARWEQGTYENELVKENGVWKIKALRYFPRMTTDYDKGWAHDAQPAPGVSRDVPPDRPPTQTYASYPRVTYVAFHFVHPVTGKAVRTPGASTKVQAIDASGGSNDALRGDTGSVLTDLEARLNMAIGVDAVENLNSSYGYYIDESAWDQMADTFSVTGGAKEITGAGTYVGQERIRKILNLRGPRGGRTPDFFTIHQLTQPVIHVAADGKTAKARLRLFQLGGNSDGSSGSWIGGIYENTALVENGEWKFGIQDLHHIFNASYRNGWARFSAQPARGAAPAGQRGGGAGVQVPAAGARSAAPPSAASNPAPGATGASGRNVPGGGIQQGLGGAASPNRFVSEMPPDRPIRARQYAFPEIVEPAFHYRNPVTGRMPKELLP
jgi:hypothetical protein